MATIFGTRGDDRLVPNGTGDLVFGLAGNDTLATGISDVELHGGAGADALQATVRGTPTGDGDAELAIVRLFGGNGNDEVTADTRLLQTQAVQGRTAYVAVLALEGGSGDDSLTSSLLNRVVTGGEQVSVGISAQLRGGDGEDALTTRARLVTDSTGFADLGNSVAGGLGDDLLTSVSTLVATNSGPGASVFLDSWLQGDGGNDQLSGRVEMTSASRGNANLGGAGGEGNDMLSLRGSADVADSGQLSLTADGGNGNDHLFARANLVAGATGLVLIAAEGGGGRDTLALSCGFQAGEEGILQLSGRGDDGNDRIALNGGFEAGTDALFSLTAAGGQGSDHVAIDQELQFGDELLQLELFALGGDFDTLDNGDDVIDVVLDLTARRLSGFGEVWLDGDGGDDAVSLRLTANFALDVFPFLLTGGDGDDRLSCSIAADGPAQVVLDGGAGNDRLVASGDNSSRIHGGAGSDRMAGGTGTEQYVFDLLDLADGVGDRDWITNYSRSDGDSLLLPNGIDDVTGFRVVGGDTRLTLVGDGDVIVLRDVVVDDLATDVLFV